MRGARRGGARRGARRGEVRRRRPRRPHTQGWAEPESEKELKKLQERERLAAKTADQGARARSVMLKTAETEPEVTHPRVGGARGGARAGSGRAAGCRAGRRPHPHAAATRPTGFFRVSTPALRRLGVSGAGARDWASQQAATPEGGDARGHRGGRGRHGLVDRLHRVAGYFEAWGCVSGAVLRSTGYFEAWGCVSGAARRSAPSSAASTEAVSRLDRGGA